MKFKKTGLACLFMRQAALTCKVKTFALLDSGSQTSLILEKFADAIGLVGKDSPLQLGTINSSGEPIRSRKVSFHVGAVEGPEAGVQVTVEEAWTIPQLNLPPQSYACYDAGFPAPN